MVFGHTRFANSRSADGKAFKRKLCQFLGTIFTEIRIIATLADTEKGLIRSCLSSQASLSPADGTINRILPILFRTRIRSTFIKTPDNIGSDIFF